MKEKLKFKVGRKSLIKFSLATIFILTPTFLIFHFTSTVMSSVQVEGVEILEYAPSILGDVWSKKIVVYNPGLEHYYNVSVETNIPENLKDVELYRYLTQQMMVRVSDDPTYDFKVLDTDNNRRYDTVSWVVPELSEVVFKIEGVFSEEIVTTITTIPLNETTTTSTITTTISTTTTIPVELKVEFDRDLDCPRCGKHKAPPLTDVNMTISATVSNPVENANLTDYYPNDWVVVDTNGGTVSQYNSSYNEIKWNVGNVTDSVSKWYLIKSPQRTSPPTKYYFWSELEGEKSDLWQVIVADPEYADWDLWWEVWDVTDFCFSNSTACNSSAENEGIYLGVSSKVTINDEDPSSGGTVEDFEFKEGHFYRIEIHMNETEPSSASSDDHDLVTMSNFRGAWDIFNGTDWVPVYTGTKTQIRTITAWDNYNKGEVWINKSGTCSATIPDCIISRDVGTTDSGVLEWEQSGGGSACVVDTEDCDVEYDFVIYIKETSSTSGNLGRSCSDCTVCKPGNNTGCDLITVQLDSDKNDGDIKFYGDAFLNRTDYSVGLICDDASCTGNPEAEYSSMLTRLGYSVTEGTGPTAGKNVLVALDYNSNLKSYIQNGNATVITHNASRKMTTLDYASTVVESTGITNINVTDSQHPVSEYYSGDLQTHTDGTSDNIWKTRGFIGRRLATNKSAIEEIHPYGYAEVDSGGTLENPENAYDGSLNDSSTYARIYATTPPDEGGTIDESVEYYWDFNEVYTGNLFYTWIVDLTELGDASAYARIYAWDWNTNSYDIKLTRTTDQSLGNYSLALSSEYFNSTGGVKIKFLAHAYAAAGINAAAAEINLSDTNIRSSITTLATLGIIDADDEDTSSVTVGARVAFVGDQPSTDTGKFLTWDGKELFLRSLHWAVGEGLNITQPNNKSMITVTAGNDILVNFTVRDIYFNKWITVDLDESDVDINVSNWNCSVNSLTYDTDHWRVNCIVDADASGVTDLKVQISVIFTGRPYDYSTSTTDGGVVSQPTNAYDNSFNDTFTYARFWTPTYGTSKATYYFSGIHPSDTLFYTWKQVDPGTSKGVKCYNYNSGTYDILDITVPDTRTTESVTIPAVCVNSTGDVKIRFDFIDSIDSYDYYVYDHYIKLSKNASWTDRDVEFSTVNITPETEAPKYGTGNQTNSTSAGVPVLFSLNWTDNVGLDSFTFSLDNCTGTLVNVTNSSFPIGGTVDWSNVTHVINETEGCTIRWKVYANDTKDNWNASQVYEFNTIILPPKYSLNSTNSTYAGEPVEFRLKWTDDSALDSYIFSLDNCIGSFSNVTESKFPIGGTVDWSNVTHVINETEGCTIRWKVYANDTKDNWNASLNYSFETTIIWLNVTLLTPDPFICNESSPCVWNQTWTYSINATVECMNGECGNVLGTARYNESTNPDTAINTTYDTPFYTFKEGYRPYTWEQTDSDGTYANPIYAYDNGFNDTSTNADIDVTCSGSICSNMETLEYSWNLANTTPVSTATLFYTYATTIMTSGGGAGNTYIIFRDWSEGGWDTKNTSSVSLSQKTRHITITSKYISSTGQIKVRFRAQAAAPEEDDSGSAEIDLYDTHVSVPYVPGFGNPLSCGSMSEGDTCQLNWTVNVTGSTVQYRKIDVNFTSDYAKIASNDTSDAVVKINPLYGRLVVNLSDPYPVIYNESNPLEVSQYYTFWVDATVECVGGQICGEVNGSVRYNESEYTEMLPTYAWDTGGDETANVNESDNTYATESCGGEMFCKTDLLNVSFTTSETYENVTVEWKTNDFGGDDIAYIECWTGSDWLSLTYTTSATDTNSTGSLSGCSNAGGIYNFTIWGIDGSDELMNLYVDFIWINKSGTRGLINNTEEVTPLYVVKEPIERGRKLEQSLPHETEDEKTETDKITSTIREKIEHIPMSQNTLFSQPDDLTYTERDEEKIQEDNDMKYFKGEKPSIASVTSSNPSNCPYGSIHIEVIDGGFHLQNEYEDYYVNADTGGVTNDPLNPWFQDVFCIGSSEIEEICSDSMSWVWHIDTNNKSYVNLTGIADFSESYYSGILTLEYYLGRFDKKIRITPKYKNTGLDLTDFYIKQRTHGIRINGTYEEDALILNTTKKEFDIYDLHSVSGQFTPEDLKERQYEIWERDYDGWSSIYAKFEWSDQYWMNGKSNTLNFKLDIVHDLEYNALMDLFVNFGKIKKRDRVYFVLFLTDPDITGVFCTSSGSGECPFGDESCMEDYNCMVAGSIDCTPSCPSRAHATEVSNNCNRNTAACYDCDETYHCVNYLDCDDIVTGTCNYNCNAGWYNDNGIGSDGCENAAPRWYTPSINATSPVELGDVSHNVNWTDTTGDTDIGLGVNYTILEINGTGASCDSWGNVSTVARDNVQSVWSNITWTVPDVCGGRTIGWRQYANDSADRWNVTDIQTYDVKEGEPIISVIATPNTTSVTRGEYINVSATITCFGGQCNSTNATISLPNLFELVDGETAKHELGDISVGTYQNYTSWIVKAIHDGNDVINVTVQSVNSTGEINDTDSTPTITVAKPENPKSCGNMYDGDTCTIKWLVNATGAINSAYKIDVNFTSDDVNIVSNDTEDAVVKIVSGPDTTPPRWSDNKTYPTSPVTYSPGASYQFNVTWQDPESNVSVALIEQNFTTLSASLENKTMSNQSSEHYWSVTDLPAGTYIWKVYANNTDNYWNLTSQWTYTIDKGSTETKLYLNDTQGDRSYNKTEIANLTATTNVSSLTISIYANYSGSLELANSSIGSTYNFTDTSNLDLGNYLIKSNTTGNENYTSSQVNYTLTVVDQLIPGYSNPNVNTTVASQPANFSLGWTDNDELDGYIFSTNNSGTWINSSFVSWSGTPTSSTSWNVTVLNPTIGTLVQWKFYANDTSDNWDVSETYNLTTTELYLEVNLTNPDPRVYNSSNPKEVTQYTTFVVNATVTCRGGNCDDVNGTVRYNKFSEGHFEMNLTYAENSTQDVTSEVNVSDNVYAYEGCEEEDGCTSNFTYYNFTTSETYENITYEGYYTSSQPDASSAGQDCWDGTDWIGVGSLPKDEEEIRVRDISSCSNADGNYTFRAYCAVIGLGKENCKMYIDYIFINTTSKEVMTPINTTEGATPFYILNYSETIIPTINKHKAYLSETTDTTPGSANTAFTDSNYSLVNTSNDQMINVSATATPESCGGVNTEDCDFAQEVCEAAVCCAWSGGSCSKKKCFTVSESDCNTCDGCSWGGGPETAYAHLRFTFNLTEAYIDAAELSNLTYGYEGYYINSSFLLGTYSGWLSYKNDSTWTREPLNNLNESEATYTRNFTSDIVTLVGSDNVFEFGATANVSDVGITSETITLHCDYAWIEATIFGNTKICGNLNENQICTRKWIINATGTVNSVHEVDVNFSSSTSQVSPNDTDDAFVKISGDVPPTYSLNSTNSTVAGTPVEHRLKWTDNTGLSYAIFSFDNCTGTLENITNTSLSGSPDWSNFTVTINSTPECTIRWCVYANDTNDNWNGTSCDNPFSYTTSGAYLEVNLTYPPLNLNVIQNTTFNINATVTCRQGSCGTVKGTVRYNASSSNPDTPINNTEEATPFYITKSYLDNSLFGDTTDLQPNPPDNKAYAANDTLTDDFFQATTEIGNYTVINVSDNSRENSYADSNIDGQNRYTFQRFTFNLSQFDTSEILNLSYCIEGYRALIVDGQSYDYDAEIRYYNVTDSTWYLDQNVPTGDSVSCNSFTSEFNDLINSTDGLFQFGYRGRIQCQEEPTCSPAVELDLYADNVYINITTRYATISCGNINENGVCHVNWILNATGAIDSQWKVGVLFNSSSGSIDDNHTDNSTITIISPPLISLWSPQTLDFGTLSPSTNWNNATQNPDNFYNISVDSGSCTVDIWIKGTELENVTLGSKIAVGNVTWNNYFNWTASTNMTKTYALVNSSISQNTNVTTYYWLNVPAIYAGGYNGTITICANCTTGGDTC